MQINIESFIVQLFKQIEEYLNNPDNISLINELYDIFIKI